MPQEYEEKPNDHSPRPGHSLFLQDFEHRVKHVCLLPFTTEHATEELRRLPPRHCLRETIQVYCTVC